MGSCCTTRDTGKLEEGVKEEVKAGRPAEENPQPRMPMPQESNLSSSLIKSRNHSPRRRVRSPLVEKIDQDRNNEQFTEAVEATIRNISLEDPIPSKIVSETWVSPLTCVGAQAGMSLLDILKDEKLKELNYRNYIKTRVIETNLLTKLLKNLNSRNSSMRHSSAMVLSQLITPDQLELIRLFLENLELPVVKSILIETQNEELKGCLSCLIRNCYIHNTPMVHLLTSPGNNLIEAMVKATASFTQLQLVYMHLRNLMEFYRPEEDMFISTNLKILKDLKLTEEILRVRESIKGKRSKEVDSILTLLDTLLKELKTLTA